MREKLPFNPSMADLHCHLLPGVDDGSKSVEQSIQVLDSMATEGIGAVCLTPHMAISDLDPSRFYEHLRKHDDAYDQLMRVAPASPKCYRGVELMVDGAVPSNAVINARITLGGSRYILIEFPPDLSALAIRGLIREIVLTGFVPLVAHAERYIVATPSEVFRWREQGAVAQVDATTLSQGRGHRAQRAKAILEAGLADIVAADNHGDRRTLTTAARYLQKIGAQEQADYLLVRNPHAVLNNQSLEPVPAIRFSRSPWERVSSFFRP